jgi:hypothetical protein
MKEFSTIGEALAAKKAPLKVAKVVQENRNGIDRIARTPGHLGAKAANGFYNPKAPHNQPFRSK